MLVVGIDLGGGQTKDYSASERGLAQAYEKNHHLTFPVLLDLDKTSSALFRKKGIAIPYNVVVDDQGMVRYSALGFHAQGDSLNRMVAELLSAPPAEKPATATSPADPSKK